MFLDKIKKFFRCSCAEPPAKATRPDDPYNPDITSNGMIAVTYRCQCRCKHCGSEFFGKDRAAEMTTQQIKDIIKQFPALHLHSVSFFGGEPLLREDLLELIRYGKSLGLSVVIDTNGAALDEKMAKNLAEAGLDMALISLDSPDAEIHDGQRGFKGLFDKVIAAIGYCKKYGIVPRIATYVDREKLESGQFERLIALGEKLDVELRILLAVLAGRLNEDTSQKLTPEEIRKFKSMLKPGRAFWEQDVCASVDANFICSAITKKMFYVTAYGDVTPCCYVPLGFGNVGKEPLADILKRMYAHPMFEHPNCTDCIMNDPVFRNNYCNGFKTADSYPIPIDLADCRNSCANPKRDDN